MNHLKIKKMTNEELKSIENAMIENVIWDNIRDIESAMVSVLNLTTEMAYEWHFDFADAKKGLLSDADDILDTYIEGLAEVDSELAGKVETCIKSIVEEVKAINNHDDIDWDEFELFDIEDVLEEVRNLIAKLNAE